MTIKKIKQWLKNNYHRALTKLETNILSLLIQYRELDLISIEKIIGLNIKKHLFMLIEDTVVNFRIKNDNYYYFSNINIDQIPNKKEDKIKTKTTVSQCHCIGSKSINETLKEIEKETNSKNYVEGIIDKKQNTKALIEVRNLSKEFKTAHGTKKVIDDISFDIIENQNLAILGGNGAGKTTLVEILVGLNKQTSGNIKFNYSYQNSHLEKIGIQFQESSYPPGISVKNIINFIIEAFNVKIDKEELMGLIKIFGIDGFYKRRASSLSGGQLQRLNALIAIIQKPKIIFLDELSTGLDISIRTRIREFIKAYAKENNMTIVLVSHDMGEIDYLCDQIIFLKYGKIIVNTSKQNIIKKFGSLEKFVTKYIHN